MENFARNPLGQLSSVTEKSMILAWLEEDRNLTKFWAQIGLISANFSSDPPQGSLLFARGGGGNYLDYLVYY